MGRVQAHPADRRIAKSIEYHRKLYQIINAMDHYTGNITPDKDIIPDNIWYCEEWYKAAHNRLSCEQGVPLDAGASCGMVQRIGNEKGKDGRRREQIRPRHDPLRRPSFPLPPPGGAHHSVWPGCGDEGRRHWRISLR